MHTSSGMHATWVGTNTIISIMQIDLIPAQYKPAYNWLASTRSFQIHAKCQLFYDF